MRRGLPLLLLGLLVGSQCLDVAVGQRVDPSVCTETQGAEMLPPMPANFHAFLSSFSSSPPGNQQGHLTIAEDTDGSGRGAVYYKASDGATVKLFFDYAAGQVLLHDVDAGVSVVDNCQVINTTIDTSTLLMRFSYKNTQRVVPTGKFLSAGPALRIVKGNAENVNGISATPFRTCHYAPSIQGTVEAVWWYAAGSQSPMQVRIRYKLTGSDNIVDTVYSLSPLHSLPIKQEAASHMFMPPRGVYCKGWQSNNKLPSPLGSRFSLGAEQFASDQPAGRQPFRLRESYDQRANLSMLEGPGTAGDRVKYGYGRLARINDFTRGISYVKNIGLGNCTYEKIPESGWDTQQSSAGPRIKSPEQFFFPSREQLQYKGSGVHRLTDVDVYIGYVDDLLNSGDPASKISVAIEYYLRIRETTDAAGNPVHESMPVMICTATNSNVSTTTEMFDIDTGVPRSYDHDISTCFDAIDKQHFELIMDTSGLSDSHVRFLDVHRDELMYALVNSLAKATNISPLRIIEPKVSLFAAPLVLAEITVGERVTVPGYSPPMPEIPLSQLASAMTMLLSTGSLKVDLIIGRLAISVPIKDFVSLDSRGESSTQGLSAGAAVGLAIGMLLLGVLLALGALLVAGHFRHGNALFGFKPFGGGGNTQQEVYAG